MKRAPLVALSIAGSATAIAFAIVSPTIANAAVQENCVEDTTQLTDRDDSGHFGKTWAKDTMPRVTRICFVKTVDEVSTFKATVNDKGTFVTLAGDDISPNKGKTLVGGINGKFFGSFTQDFTAPVDANWKDHINLNPPTTTTTGNWVRAVWGVDFTPASAMNNDWSWTYNTCSEQWIDAASNDAGGAVSAGEITGSVPCPEPTTPPVIIVPPTTEPPVVVPTTTAPPVVVPSTTAPVVVPSTTTTTPPAVVPTSTTSPAAIVPVGNNNGGALPVTGKSLTLFAITGFVLVVGGGLALVLVRRKREDSAVEEY